MLRLLPFIISFLLLVPAGRAAALQDSFEAISVSSAGIPGNAASSNPSISADGRFVAFESAADNLFPGDANGQPDIFLRDRQTGETRLLSVTTAGVQGDGPSTQPAISGNGRTVAFVSSAANLVPGDANGVSDVFVFDRITGLIRLVTAARGGAPADGPSSKPDIDHAGRYLAFESSAGNLTFAGEPGDAVYLFDLLTGTTIRVAPGHSPAISGDGRLVAFVNAAGGISVYHRVLGILVEATAAGVAPRLSFSGRNLVYLAGDGVSLLDRDSGAVQTLPAAAAQPLALADDFLGLLYRDGGDLVWRAPASGPAAPIWEGDAGAVADLSADGQVLVFSSAEAAASAHSQIVLRALSPQPDSFHLAGRITDALGRPLALVTITDGRGGSTRTDMDGYFYLSGYPAGPLTLTPEKEGFAFAPLAWNLSVFRDVAGYHFTASPEETLLEEARLDIGMPYSFNRGCENPYEGCGKPFHGFAAGFCTDLILDAYTYGLEYNISYALEQDAYANPEHFYRWRDARNAHDMWRYFHFSGQMLDPADDFLPGDIVFFDWSGDGEIDHVALVSEVVAGRPVRLIDATGITEQNPTGLAAELDWLGFHEDTVRGHARWHGAYEPVSSGYPPGARVLQTALSGGGLFMRIIDSAGNAVSFGESSLRGGVYFDLDWEEVISVVDPSGRYTVEIRGLLAEPAPFIFTLQTLSGGRFTGRAAFSGAVAPGEVVTFTWEVGQGSDGALSLRAEGANKSARIPGRWTKP